MGLPIVRAVRSGDVVKPFPFGEFSREIDVTFVAEKLVKTLADRIGVSTQLYH